VLSGHFEGYPSLPAPGAAAIFSEYPQRMTMPPPRANATRPDLSVIIPAYNEAGRFGPHIPAILAYLGARYPAFELLVVDDGSTDQTAAVVQAAIAAEPRAHLISYQPNRGKGYAIRTGVLASHGDRVVFLDADLSTPVDEIPRALAELQTADIVVGSRGLPDSDIRVRPPLYRRLASALFDMIKHLMVGLWHISDTQCGFKAFRGEAARQLFALGQVDRFMFDVEILYLAERAQLRLKEMPVHWADAAGSKVRFWEGVVNMIRDLWRIRRLHRGPVTIQKS
jgi:dolichyl-phosphate beta-glucosyltransferase